MSDYEISIGRVKEILQNVNSTKSQDAIVSKALFSALSGVFHSAKTGQESILLANANMLVLEEVCSSRFLSLGKSLQSIVVSIYDLILSKAPGYAVRNAMNTMVAICSNKSFSNGSRECSTAVIGAVIEKRSFDCGSILNDIIACMTKLIKGSDVSHRIVAFKALSALVIGAGPRIGDTHLELLKLAGKYVSDKNVEVKLHVAGLISAIARQSSGCSSVPPELLVSSCAKGLEDESLYVQDAFARAFASIFSEQIRSHLDLQEKAKIGIARGGTSEQTPSPQKKRFTMGMSQRIAKLNLTSSISSSTKIVEDFQFKSVVNHIIKNITKSSTMLRNGHIAILSYLVLECLDSLDQAELEWLVAAVASMLNAASIGNMSYEEVVFFRSRISNLLSTSISNNLPEARLLQYTSALTQLVTGADVRTEHELQLALVELCHVVIILGEGASAVLDEVHAGVITHLRHSAFGVRSAAANVLSCLAEAVPGVAAGFLRAALSNAKAQSKQLSSVDKEDVSSAPPIDSSDDSLSPDGGRRKSPKEIERIQRMYFFHGHTLVISLLLKNENKVRNGLPKALILEVLDFGLELLGQDVLAVPAGVRNIACSLLRAGSLVVSSCLNMGYAASRARMLPMLHSCDAIFKQANATAVPSGGNQGGQAGRQAAGTRGAPASTANGDDLLFELMSVEAALVCISTLLWCCPEALEFEPGCLALVIDGLEMAFRALKGKYQPKFRTHFRFRTLHVILLECFAWLPPGSFSGSTQQLFVEGLRVFRDSISAGCECTCLVDTIVDDYGVLAINGVNAASAGTSRATSSNAEMPINQDMYVLRLENHAVALQKRESEAFLATFGKDGNLSEGLRSQFLLGVDWLPPRAPCAQVDSRTIDAAIAVIGSTFGLQSSEYQDKAVQLCSQAIAQLSKSSSSLGMFSSDEEKRRRDRKAFVTVKNVVACLATIVKYFPFAKLSTGMPNLGSTNLSWGRASAEHMVEVLNHSNLEIRCAAANTLARLCGGMTKSSLLESMFSQLSSSLIQTAEKKGETMADHAGSLLSFALLWDSAENRPNTQKNILSTLLDNLRRVDLAPTFRAHGLYALCGIVREAHGSALALTPSSAATAGSPERSSSPSSGGGDQHVETLSLLERVCHLAEINVVSVNSGEDSELLYCCLQRLVRSAVPVGLQLIEDIDAEREREGVSKANSTDSVDSQGSTPGGSRRELGAGLRADVDRILSRMMRIWELIRGSTSLLSIQCESLSLIGDSIEYAPFFELLPPPQVAAYLAAVIESTAQALANAEMARTVVRCVVVLAAKFPTVVYQSGLDIGLYQVLNWCISHKPPPGAISYSGLDLRCGPQLGMKFLETSDMSSLQLEVEESILEVGLKCVTHSDNSNNGGPGDVSDLDVKAIRYLLFCRAVALGLRGGGGGGGADGDGGGDGGDGDEEGGARESPVIAPSAGLGASEVGPLTHQQFVLRCREDAAERAAGLLGVSILVKCVAARCASEVFKCIVAGSAHTHAGHSDIQLARSITTESLSKLGANPTNVDSVPCFAALFLQDIVNLGCALATFTVNDKRLLVVQEEAMMLLQSSQQLFFDTKDPDHSHSADDGSAPSQEKILAQYISQIVSAVRPALATPGAPNLSLAAGQVICELVRGGLLSDKVAVRRLVKGLVAFAEAKEGAPALAARARQSADMSDEAAVCDHIINAQILAQLFVLTSSGASFVSGCENGDVDASVAAALIAMLQEHLPALHDVWTGIATDAVRVRQAFPVKSSNAVLLWPVVTIDTDPRRGGITYPPSAHPAKISPLFLKALPTVLLALARSSSLLATDAPLIFTFLQSVLEDATKTMAKAQNPAKCIRFPSQLQSQSVQSQSPTAATESQLSALAALAELASRSSILSPTGALVPVEEWANVLTFVVQVVIPQGLRSQSQAVKRSIVSKVLGLIGHVRVFIEADNPVARNGSQAVGAGDAMEHTVAAKKQLWDACWVGTLAIIHSAIPSVFKAQSQASVDVFDEIIAGKLPHIWQSPVSITQILELSSGVGDGSVGGTAVDLLVTTPGAGSEKQNPVISVVGRSLTLLSVLTQARLRLPLWASGSSPLQAFTVQLLAAVLPVLGVVLSGAALRSHRDALLALVLEQLHTLTDEGLRNVHDESGDALADLSVPFVTNGQLLRLLMDELLGWHLIDSGKSQNNKKLYSSSPSLSSINVDVISSVVDSIVNAWKSTVVRWASTSQHRSIPAPICLSVIVMQSGSWPSLAVAVLRQVLLIVQTDPVTLGRVMMETVFPATLCALRVGCSGPARLQGGGGSAPTTSIDESVELLLVQLVFLAFGTVVDERKGDFVGMILPPLCAVLGRHATEAQVAVFAGRGLTHLARSCADAFRMHVGALGEEERARLQAVMRLVLQQAAAAGQAQGGSATNATSPAPVKKIDMSRYRKET